MPAANGLSPSLASGPGSNSSNHDWWLQSNGTAMSDRLGIITELASAGIPLVLIGAQAMRVLGSSRESLDIDFAIREVDVDAVIDALYAHGYRMPISVSSDGNSVQWAKDAQAASDAIVQDKRGALNMYFLDSDGDPIDQMDFVFDNPVPFARLYKYATSIRTDPEIRSASLHHLIIMKETRIKRGDAGPNDEIDLAFLRALEISKKA